MQIRAVLQYEGRALRWALKQTLKSTKPHLKTILATLLGVLALTIISIYVPFIQKYFKGDTIMQEWILALLAVAGLVGIVIGIFLKNVALAPSFMEKEAEMKKDKEITRLNHVIVSIQESLRKLEEVSTPKFAVYYTSGKSIPGDRNELSSWAELKIRNTSTSADITKVKVKIVDLMLVYEEQDEKGVGTGTYRLTIPCPQWEISSVIWSGRTGNPGEIERTIHPNETECTTIAYNLKNRSDVGVFNVRNFPSVWESRITIEVSGTGSNTWKGIFYIEYRPPGVDEFEFIEWGDWLKSHKLIEPSTPDTGDGQPK